MHILSLFNCHLNFNRVAWNKFELFVPLKIMLNPFVLRESSHRKTTNIGVVEQLYITGINVEAKKN